MLHFTVQGQSLSCVQDAAVSDSIDYIECRFDFDDAWKNLTKTAQFSQNGTTYNAVLSDDFCRMPNEICAGEISISVFGVLPGKTLRITTEPVTVRMLCSGFVSSATEPIPPSPDLYAQLIQKVTDAADGVPDAVEKKIAEKKLLSQDDVLDAPDASSSMPVSGKALNAAVSPLSKVARTGKYSDLSDLPTIPQKVSDLENDCRFIASESENETNTVLSNSYVDLYSAGTIISSNSGIIQDSEKVEYITWSRDDSELTVQHLKDPTNETDAANKKYVDSKVSGISLPTKVSQLENDREYIRKSDAKGMFVPNVVSSISSLEVGSTNGKFYFGAVRGGTINIYSDDGTLNITGVTYPTADTDAATKKYVDNTVPTKVSQLENDSRYIQNTGTDISEYQPVIGIGSDSIYEMNLSAYEINIDSGSSGYVSIRNLSEPTNDRDAATKGYVDEAVSAQHDKVFESVEEITLTEETEQIERTAKPNGTAYHFEKLLITADTPKTDAVGRQVVRLYVNGNTFDLYNTAYESSVTYAKRSAFLCSAENGFLKVEGINGVVNYGDEKVPMGTSTMSGTFTPTDTITKFRLKGEPSFAAGTKIKIYGVKAIATAVATALNTAV